MRRARFFVFQIKRRAPFVFDFLSKTQKSPAGRERKIVLSYRRFFVFKEKPQTQLAGNLKKHLQNVEKCDILYEHQTKMYRGIAQLVEQRSPKPRVQSSSLCAPAKTEILGSRVTPTFSGIFLLLFSGASKTQKVAILRKI